VKNLTRYLGALLVPVAVFGFAPAAFAADGVVLINQATSINGLPGCGSHGFPIVICQAGSYRLSGNLTVASGQAVKITADNAALDLNGFAVLGSGRDANGMFPASGGIVGTGSFDAVSNGSIRGFEIGVLLDGAHQTVRNVTVSDANDGISVASGIIADSTVNGATRNAISAGNGLVEHCRAMNSGTGISMGIGLVLGNEIVGNATAGLAGGAAGYGSNFFVNNGVDVQGSVPSFFSQGDNICSIGKC